MNETGKQLMTMLASYQVQVY